MRLRACMYVCVCVCVCVCARARSCVCETCIDVKCVCYYTCSLRMESVPPNLEQMYWHLAIIRFCAVDCVVRINNVVLVSLWSRLLSIELNEIPISRTIPNYRPIVETSPSAQGVTTRTIAPSAVRFFPLREPKHAQ